MKKLLAFAGLLFGLAVAVPAFAQGNLVIFYNLDGHLTVHSTGPLGKSVSITPAMHKELMYAKNRCAKKLTVHYTEAHINPAYAPSMGYCIAMALTKPPDLKTLAKYRPWHETAMQADSACIHYIADRIRAIEHIAALMGMSLDYTGRYATMAGNQAATQCIQVEKSFIGR